MLMRLSIWQLVFVLCLSLTSIATLATVDAFTGSQIRNLVLYELKSGGPEVETTKPLTFDDALFLIGDKALRDVVRVSCGDHRKSEEAFKECIGFAAMKETGEPVDWDKLSILDDLGPVTNVQTSAATIKLGYFAWSIFAVLAVCQAACLFDALRKFREERSIFTNYYGWLVDTPPVLGICGTLFALMSFLSSATSGVTSEQFLSAFSIAALTTLAGGLTSICNHFLLSYADSA